MLDSLCALRDYVGVLDMGAPVEEGGVRFYPLFVRDLRAERADPPVCLLEEVEGLRVEETSNVGQLWVVNESDTRVLLLEGDIVEGGRQNRVINATCVVEPGTRTPLPTSCVEQGRWGQSKGHFSGSGHSVSPKVRSALKRSVTETLTSTGGASFASDQSAVWASTTVSLNTHGSSNATSDHMQVYRDKQAELKTQAARVESQLQDPRLIGLAVTHADGSAVVEAFGSPRIAAKVLERIVCSHLLNPPGDAGHAEAGGLLPAIAQAPGESSPASTGSGEQVRLSESRLAASACVYGGATLHLSADWE